MIYSTCGGNFMPCEVVVSSCYEFALCSACCSRYYNLLCPLFAYLVLFAAAYAVVDTYVVLLCIKC